MLKENGIKTSYLLWHKKIPKTCEQLFPNTHFHEVSKDISDSLQFSH